MRCYDIDRRMENLYFDDIVVPQRKLGGGGDVGGGGEGQIFHTYRGWRYEKSVIDAKLFKH